MPCLLRLFLALVFAWLAHFPLQAQGQHEGRPPVQASLLADTSAIVPGRAFQIGLLLEMAPGWHTYWEYSGEVGLPTQIDWDLPPGFRAGPIAWPVPEAILEPGDIQTYAYSGSVLLLTTIIPPTDLPPTAVTLQAKASWLACGALCIPGEAALSLALPVSESATLENAGLFEQFRAQIPSRERPPYGLLWQRTGDILQLRVTGLPPSAPLALFPLPASSAQAVGHPRFIPPATLDIASGGPFSGVLAVGEGAARRAWFVSDSAPSAASLSLWLALLYGFLGGMILNLMPCVLPVISLKVFSFIKQAEASRWHIFSHGLAFMVGVFCWFLGLAAVIIALKSGGSEVTWAFQFQNPWFNVSIGSVVFVFALNLLGVFEIVLPGRAANALDSSGGSGLVGSFFQGVFATLLATPCTAPFLGTALGFAFSQSGGVILAMFASVAFGMALPYLLLTAQPAWMRLLPRPGAWMEQLKHFMAFPLFATLVWIFSILNGQLGGEGVVWFTAFLLCLGFACWLYGSFCGPLSSRFQRAVVLGLVVAVTAGGGWYFLGKKLATSDEITPDTVAWVPFSEARVLAERAAGKSVFVDFTADWCITCKFNARTAIDTPTIRALLAEKHVVPIKADWTKANPEITAVLKRFGRVGVPFYVIYPAGERPPVVLPEILTEQILAEALKNLP